MAAHRDSILELFGEEDLIEVHVNSSRNPASFANLFLPNPRSTSSSAQPRPVHHHQSRRSERRPQPQGQQPQQPAPVIDLTAEPDSPVQTRGSLPQNRSGRNPRRTNSQRISPPQLSRSDGTFFGRTASIIDLTVDSPEGERPSNPPGGRNMRPRPRPDELIELELISSMPREQSGRRPPASFAIGLTRTIAGLLSRDIMFPPPQLDVSRNAFAPREPSPKPAMEPIPPAREGFTRDTCTDPEKESESVVICPACSEELAYDPSGTMTQSSVGGNKGKRKRAPGEHHFWALKKCGHVYCADCFENRKPTKSNRDGVGFRAPEGKHPYTAANDLRCAVEGCETKVSSKTEWVGIFL
ncbi:uncharacterized protein NECHADRAFT_42977 [Fusarium vanettenii 77-13-4]|uniref:Cell cycle control protein n=1 Tax=Fusarium vanettenii (strain ATCC MYA-4622 / CBS 123669 / FGSC 9596 / NRRL 45880 / 77-13-4) TaxID=660122 RepID=C7Z8X8_FUSV7|nr:uncharacterized protein NECHADRAFT_42977 [Fusarium vanettenii 77-13-4]EEU39462.1 hypothetical protein NECHADRAFT_42977 [Fusarium vanettenii 77-13-4]